MPAHTINTDDLTARAANLGREQGTSAASWVFDGNTSIQRYREVLAGIRDGDPMVMDSIREPSLSGEYGDDYCLPDLARDLNLDVTADNANADMSLVLLSEAADAWQAAASESFWQAIEATAAEHVTEARAQSLRSAGFLVRYAWRPDEQQDYITWSDVQDYPADGYEPYVDLSSVARGEDAAGQSTTVDRSNYRSLRRDYADTFTPVSYSNVDALGAFIADLTDDLTDILTALKEQYPLYDESDHSELESEEITDSWEQYVSYDIQPDIHSDKWDELSGDQQSDLFWSVVSDLDIYPEHDGLDIRWSVHYPAIGAEITRRLS